MSKLRDGVTKRGNTWSYIVRVPDPESGRTRPKWVGGFQTEAAAKAARGDARVAARRGTYVDRSALTVREYLTEWLEAHQASVKRGTIAGYRADVERYITPRIGGLRLQSLRPAILSKLYRDLAGGGGTGGGPLSASTVAHVHRTLRKALTDAVRVEQVLATNPAERAKLPRSRRGERAPSGAPPSSPPSSTRRPRTGCPRSSGSPPTPAPAVASCSPCAGRRSTWTPPR
jgi:integrase